MTDSTTHPAIEAIWKLEFSRLIASLTRLVRDVGLAEELAQDSLVAALTQWPESGIPRNPGAWLMVTAKRRAIDHLRRQRRLQFGLEAPEAAAPDPAEPLDDELGDDLLRLMFTACHPLLPTEARVALTLRLLGGLTTEEIARAFLASPSTIAQRIVRAKRTLADARVPFEVPRGTELTARLASVLEAIYLIFNEGYSATAGADWMRPTLCEDALRLGRVLAGLMPAEPEVHGLLALLEIQASRTPARLGPSGEPILLLAQDRSLWDQLLIQRGLTALAHAEALAPARGAYTLQAAIAACHARALEPEATDWLQISALYAELARLTPSPVVELNRAVAVSMAFGPSAGLQIVDALADEPRLQDYHLLPGVRGDLLARLGRSAEARAEFERAAALTRNSREREVLLDRARKLNGGNERQTKPPLAVQQNQRMPQQRGAEEGVPITPVPVSIARRDKVEQASSPSNPISSMDMLKKLNSPVFRSKVTDASATANGAKAIKKLQRARILCFFEQTTPPSIGFFRIMNSPRIPPVASANKAPKSSMKKLEEFES